MGIFGFGLLLTNKADLHDNFQHGPIVDSNSTIDFREGRAASPSREEESSFLSECQALHRVDLRRSLRLRPDDGPLC